VCSDIGRAESPPTDFEAFYREHFVGIARLAYLLTSDPTGAEDLAQEAFARVGPRFDTIDHPVAYTRRVVTNLALATAKRESRRREAELRTVRSDASHDAVDEVSDLIGQLPARQRAVIVLRYYTDLSEAEIAAALSCRRGTVKSLAARALGRLQQELDG